jgi:hypothetical protein
MDGDGYRGKDTRPHTLGSGLTDPCFKELYFAVRIIHFVFGSCLQKPVLLLVPFYPCAGPCSAHPIHRSGLQIKNKQLTYASSTRINAQSLQLMMWFIFNPKRIGLTIFEQHTHCRFSTV